MCYWFKPALPLVIRLWLIILSLLPGPPLKTSDGVSAKKLSALSAMNVKKRVSDSVHISISTVNLKNSTAGAGTETLELEFNVRHRLWWVDVSEKKHKHFQTIFYLYMLHQYICELPWTLQTFAYYVIGLACCRKYFGRLELHNDPKYPIDKDTVLSKHITFALQVQDPCFYLWKQKLLRQSSQKLRCYTN